MNLRLDLSYDGAPFHGFARQPSVPTVQGDLEDALGRIIRTDVETVGAGRTDAGVHALGQVVSVADAPEELDETKLRYSLNSMLSPSISVTSVRRVHDDFHARFSALSRMYVYAVLVGETPDPFLAGTTLYHPEPLDIEAMNEAAGAVTGEKDFSSFGRVPEGGSPDRLLYELRCWKTGSVVRIRARASSFIQQMVRSLVGTLLHVGEGRSRPDEMPGILEAGDRSAAGPVAPPHGLCLVSVEYDEGWSRPFDPLI